MTAARSNLRGVLGAILPQDERVLGELSQRAWIAGRDGTVVQSGGTGGSALCPWTGNVIASGGICSAYVGVPGIGSLRLYHAQGQRINLFLNSNAPATQDVTVGTGSVTISAVGSGYTLVTSAGTATATGYGAVTMGTPQVLTVSGAGTITLTVSGTPVGGYVNVEQNTFAGIKIITAGTSVTRTADNILWTPPATPAAVSDFVAIWTQYGTSGDTGVASQMVYEGYTTFQQPRLYRSSTNQFTFDARNNATTTIQKVVNYTIGAAGTLNMVTQRCTATGLTGAFGNDAFGVETAIVSAPWSQNSVYRIGFSGTAGRERYGAVAMLIIPGGLTDTERAALARALNGRIVSVLG